MQTIVGRQYYPVRPFRTLREMLDGCVSLYGGKTAFRFREDSKQDPETRTCADFQKVFLEELEYLIEQTGLVKKSLVWGEREEDGEIIVAAKMVADNDTLEAKTGQPVDEKDIRQVLDQLIKDINASLPSFKGIRHYTYSYQEKVKTTTLKICRSIEIAKISEVMNA